MDSLTQIVLGASVAAVCVPARSRRAALIAGAALGTLPDLDVLPLSLIGDPILRMTWHRSFSHSLLVLLPFGALLWWVARRRSGMVRDAPGAWLAAILLALGTHPLLDAHTIYGTQLFWPLPVAPSMWGTMFIIDPLYTLPLLGAVLVAALARERRFARVALAWGLVLSTAYLGWSWIAKWQVEQQLASALLEAGHAEAPHFSVPTPFNTWVWRMVARTPDGHLEANTTPFRTAPRLRARADDAELGQWARSNAPSAHRLDWFAHGFLRAEARGDELVLEDLRMGSDPDYFFSFVVAEREQGMWEVAPARQLPGPAMSRERLERAWQID